MGERAISVPCRTLSEFEHTHLILHILRIAYKNSHDNGFVLPRLRYSCVSLRTLFQ
jgi:hypothetical protein